MVSSRLLVNQTRNLCGSSWQKRALLFAEKLYLTRRREDSHNDSYIPQPITSQLSKV